jgi:hypothetical protein
MSRVIPVLQEIGGTGKSTTTRALAEAVPDAAIVEIETTSRLIEIEARVSHFPMRAERSEIDATAGEAALAEYDRPINHLLRQTLPTIVDVGANGAASVLQALAQMTETFARRDREIGVLVVVADDPASYTAAAKLLALSRSFAAAQFVVANDVRGPVDAALVKKIAAGAKITTLRRFVFERRVLPLVGALGLALIPSLDEDGLAERLAVGGVADDALAARTKAGLDAFRLAAMEAVRPAAEWLIG